MISRLKLANFSVFDDAELAFADGLNVLIGSNGAGKSHLLKLAYTAARWSHEMGLKAKDGIRLDRSTLQKELAEKLVRVFRPESLGRLADAGKVYSEPK
jgi:DNA repair ATPase RecN